MKAIKLSDNTLIKCSSNLTFKDKVEIVRHLDLLKVDVINMPATSLSASDKLFIRTVSAFVKNSVLSACVECDASQIENAYQAIKDAKNQRITIFMPTSAVQMEYFLHKKPAKALELAVQTVVKAKEKISDVEFVCQDATRADKAFLKDVINSVIQAGATTVTISDDEGAMLPDKFKDYLLSTIEEIPELKKAKLGIVCKDTNGLASASAVMGAVNGADQVSVAVGNCDIPSLDRLASIIKNCGEDYGVKLGVNFTEIHRTVKQVERILSGSAVNASQNSLPVDAGFTVFSGNDSEEVIEKAVKELGYDLSSDDVVRVYEEFKRVAEKKTVTLRDLDAVVASVALQVPPVYKLINYIVNSGNIISSSAQITVEKDGKEYSGVSIGDGPIDAAFRTIEQILGHKLELDDFQIQAVTEGKEAVGSAIVRIRNNGKLYSGNGVSTDIIGASIKAYINAVNKMVYEEENR